jgi:hypothetical protein
MGRRKSGRLALMTVAMAYCHITQRELLPCMLMHNERVSVQSSAGKGVTQTTERRQRAHVQLSRVVVWYSPGD